MFCETTHAAADARHRLFVVSDSVVLGAAPAIHNAFAGWDVNIIGRQGIFADAAAELAWANRDQIPADAVVAVGYNYPVWNPSLFDGWIDQMLGRLTAAGAQRVLWITLRQPQPGQDSIQSVWEQSGIYRHYPEANDKLRAAMARWPQLHLADWAAISSGGGLTWDGIHLKPAGAALMAALIHDEVYGVGRLAAGTDKRVPLGTLPAGAVAAVINVTATGARDAAFVTLHPCASAPPTASNLNVVPGQTVANLAIVPVDADASVCVYASRDVHVIVDLDGVLLPSAGLGAQNPARLLDTRTGPSKPLAHAVTRVVPSVPTGSRAAVLNITVTEPDGAGYATVFPCDVASPLASNLNVVKGQTVAGLVLATLAADGSACVTTSVGAHIVVDQQGSLAATGSYHPVVPTRLVDTRDAKGPIAAGATMTVDLPAGAVSASVTVTADQPDGAGFVTAHRCDSTRPNASNLNPVASQAVANSALVAGGRLCIFTSQRTHLVVDVDGWFTAPDSFAPLGPTRIWDTRDSTLV